jgi:hypothetical protein
VVRQHVKTKGLKVESIEVTGEGHLESDQHRLVPGQVARSLCPYCTDLSGRFYS